MRENKNTIGRSKDADRKLLEPLFAVMEKDKDEFFGRWQVKKNGAIYKTVEIFSLGSNDK